MDDRESVRLTSLDAFRGLTMLFLVPDVLGGFSFYEMARQNPDSALWTTLARVFSHAQWSGASVWDFIMPAFVFMIGLSMPYSHAARMRAGHSQANIVAHAALRAAAFLILGILFLLPDATALDFVWPLVLLSLGLPVPALLARLFDREGKRGVDFFEWLWWGIVLGVSAVHVAMEVPYASNFYLHDILTQVGMGYLAAFLLVGRSRRIQGIAIALILVGYWLAFLLYPLPSDDFPLSAVGVLPGDERFTGLFAHWNKGTNLVRAFDVWFLNLFPRPHPFVFNTHGYGTLNVIPMTASMIFGVMTGEFVRGRRERSEVRNGLFAGSAALLIAGLVAGWLVCPIVKSIWTPSWVLFSSGGVLLAFALLYELIDVRGYQRWTFPLVVAGRNPLILYTLAEHYRWWVLVPWRHTFGRLFAQTRGAPVLDALACLLTLWTFAWLLYRQRVFLRI